MKRTQLIGVISCLLSAFLCFACTDSVPQGYYNSQSTDIGRLPVPPLSDLGAESGASFDDAGSQEDLAVRDTGASGDVSGDSSVPPGDTSPDVGEEDTGPTSCQSNADCILPEICVFDENGEGFCQIPTGSGEEGDPCADGSDCATGICVDGACAEGCRGELDCPPGMTCQIVEISLPGGGSAMIGACVEEVVPCRAAGDCTDPAICVVDRTTDQILLTCGDPVGQGMLGTTCAVDADCPANLCVNGICSQPCERTNDCGMDGNSLCAQRSVTTETGVMVSMQLCEPKPAAVCLADAQCTSPERCVAHRSATDVEFTCGPPNAAGAEVGALCVDDGACLHNLCLNGVCASPCQSDGDCSLVANFRCDLATVDLGGGNSENVEVCVPPDPCLEGDDCLAGQVCYVEHDPNTVETICRLGNFGGGGLGQVCSGDVECSANYCYGARFRDVCAEPCLDDTDCAVEGYSCQDIALPGGTLRGCAPSAFPACTSIGDCASGTTCAILVAAGGGALESVCIPETGGSASGVPCTKDLDCDSLVCLNGFCSAPCQDTNQCTSGQICGPSDVTKGGVTDNFPLCQTVVEQQCTTTGVGADSVTPLATGSANLCTDGVRVCSEIREVSNQIVGYCSFPNIGPGLKQLGETCTADSECRENLCLGVSNECSLICTVDSDCGVGQGCSAFRISNSLGAVTNVGLCVSLCSDNDDCGVTNVCSFNPNHIDDTVDLICVSPTGIFDLGASCTAHADCRSGMCLSSIGYTGVACTSNANCNTVAREECVCPVTSPNCVIGKECAVVSSYCTAICDQNSDCSGGVIGNPLNTCAPTTYVQTPSGGAVPISTCAP
jgi:hypothetical protein